MEAAIHFGNQEWRGKVNVLYSDLRLVREAQAQLEIEGRWKVRSAVTIDDLRRIEAEKETQGLQRRKSIRWCGNFFSKGNEHHSNPKKAISNQPDLEYHSDPQKETLTQRESEPMTSIGGRRQRFGANH
jgi:hypothetical protein